MPPCHGGLNDGCRYDFRQIPGSMPGPTTSCRTDRWRARTQLRSMGRGGSVEFRLASQARARIAASSSL